MNRLIESLLATLLLILITIAAGFGLWAREEAPLIHAALWNFSSSSYDVKEHSRQQLETTQKILADVKHLVGTTDCSLNGCPGFGQIKQVPGVLPEITLLVRKAQPAVDNLASVTSHLDLAVQHVDGAIQHLDALLRSGMSTITELQAAIAQVNKTIADLDGQVTDPEIKQITANFAKAAQSAADGMTQLAAIATDGRQVADKARETYLKPVNLWWGLVKTLLPLAGSAAQVVK